VAGAQGYLLKDSTARRIAESIQDLLEGGAPISPPIARHLLLRFQEPAPIGSNTEAESLSAASAAGAGAAGSVDEAADADSRSNASLSARETEVLELVVKGFTFPEIAEVLSISTHTVTTHVRRIYRKLAVRSRSEAVYEALQQGIVSVEADSD
jgi:DNA-binding NarL/FixJ family response regulator